MGMRIYHQDVDIRRFLRLYIAYVPTPRVLWCRGLDRDLVAEYVTLVRKHFSNYEILLEGDTSFIRISPEGSQEVPLWRLKGSEISDFVAILENNPKMVMVESHASMAAYSNTPKVVKDKFKKFLLIRDQYPDVKFVAYGEFKYHFMYKLGWDGAAIKIKSERGERADPSGDDRYRSELNLAFKSLSRRMADALPKINRGAPGFGTDVIAQMMIAEATPYYLENMLRVPRMAKYEPRDMLPEEFNNNTRNISIGTRVQTDPQVRMKLPDDQIVCASCSLKYHCPEYRPKGVCILPETEGRALADYFGSTNAEEVLRGIAGVLAKQADRVQGAVEDEVRHHAEVRMKDPDARVVYSDQVTKMLDSLQKSGERYYRLIAPAVAAGMSEPRAIRSATPRDIDPAAAVAELMEMGMDRAEITAEHIEKYLLGVWHGPTRQLEGSPQDANYIDAQIGF